MAYEVATALGAPLDVFIVLKLGVPGHEELAMGAIASGGVVVLNDDVVRGMDIPSEVIEQVATEEARELERRERAYREDAPPLDVAGRVVIVVDGYASSPLATARVTARPRTLPYQTRPMMRASLDHFFDSAAAASAPAMSPWTRSWLTFDALMMAGIASGQNRKIETIDIVMLLSTAGPVLPG